MAAAVLYTAANELLIQPTEYTCFNLALEKIKWAPRRPADPAQTWACQLVLWLGCKSAISAL